MFAYCVVLLINVGTICSSYVAFISKYDKVLQLCGLQYVEVGKGFG